MLSFITSSYRKILRFIRMSSTPKDIEILPPGTHPHILNYCTLLKSGYKGSRDLERMNKYLVTEVNLYKTRAQSRHEYISAKVTSPDQSFYLAFERLRGEIEDRTDSERKSTMEAAVPASVADSDSLFPQYIAEDVVTFLKAEAYDREKDECFRTVYFSPPLPLYQLAILAKTVHSSERRYFLFAENCFWYAGTIIKVLQDLEENDPQWYVETTGSETVDSEYEVVGRSKNLKRGLKKKDKAGKWRKIPIYNNATADTGNLQAKFRKARQDFEEEIEDSVRARKAAEEELKAEIARMKAAEEETKKAAEEELKAAEEELKAKDAEIARMKAAEEELKAKDVEIARMKAAAEENLRAKKARDEEIAALRAQLRRAVPSTSAGGF